MAWSRTPEIVIFSDASPARFTYAWYSSRCEIEPFGEFARNGFKLGACVSTEYCFPLELENTPPYASSRGRFSQYGLGNPRLNATVPSGPTCLYSSPPTCDPLCTGTAPAPCSTLLTDHSRKGSESAAAAGAASTRKATRAARIRRMMSRRRRPSSLYSLLVVAHGLRDV